MGKETLHTKDFEHSWIVEFLGETNMLDTVSKLPLSCRRCPTILCELIVP